MDPDELRLLLLALIAALEYGDWRAILRPPAFGGRDLAGPGHLVRRAVAVRLVALAMQRQAQGGPLDAWRLLGDAAGLLPPALVRRDPLTGVALALLFPAPPAGAALEERVVVGLARLIWREQAELVDLRRRFAGGRMKPRDELVEGCAQYLAWVTYDPATWFRPAPGGTPWDDGVAVEPSRAVLCQFGTGVRWFADPERGGQVTQSVWQDIGGFRGLVAETLDRLAALPSPAPWCGAPGTSGLVVRRGRLRAWQHAHRRSQDLVPV